MRTSDSVSISRDLKRPSQSEIDAGLEREIHTAHDFAMRYVSSDPQLAREAFSIMARLIAKRSPQQIKLMENAKLLTPSSPAPFADF